MGIFVYFLINDFVNFNFGSFLGGMCYIIVHSLMNLSNYNSMIYGDDKWKHVHVLIYSNLP